MLKVGPHSKYPNSVEKDVIKYVCSPIASSRAAITSALDEKTVFPVKIVDGTNTAYFWGYARVESFVADEVFHDGKNVGRHSFRRVGTLAVPTEQPPAKRALSPDAELSQTRGKQRIAKEYMIDGMQFDSLLELRHFVVMKTLGMQPIRSPMTHHGINVFGKTVSYTIDFKVEVDGEICFVEIKPAYPYDEEVVRVKSIVEMTHVTCFLMYNTVFDCPFMDSRPYEHKDAYSHSAAVRGMKYSWDKNTRQVVVDYDVAYCYDESLGQGALQSRKDFNVSDYRHPKLMEAYYEARNIVPD
jgi:hypothetical protein